MHPGALAQSTVQAFSTRVLVNGVQRPVMSWNLDRELEGSLPDQVAGGAGISQASGTIVWADSEPVKGQMVNPWNPNTGWIPAEGDRVQILVSDGVSEWSRFVGVIDVANGDESGNLASKIIDRIDDLSAKVSIPAMLNTMPPLVDGGPWRMIGMSNLHYTNTALRKAKFYTTPKPEFGCTVDAPLQGSTWPLIGDVRVSHSYDSSTANPGGFPAPWGASRGDVWAEYDPKNPKGGASTVQLTLMRTAEHTGVAFLRCMYGTASVELRINAANAQARVNGTVVAQVVCTGNAVVQVLFKAGTATVKVTGGATASGAASLGTAATMDNVILAVNADGRVAGMMVSHPTSTSHEFASVEYLQSARINTGLMHSGSLALPAVVNESARDVLDKIGKALLRPFWIDENGMLACVASDALYNAPVAQTLTTLDNIRSLSWRQDLLSVRSEVQAKFLWPAVTSRKVASVTVYEGQGSSVMESGDTSADFIEPSAEEDWVMVDDNPLVAGTASFDGINKGIGSLIGGVYTKGDTDAEQWGSLAGVHTTTLEPIGSNKWLLSNDVGSLATDYRVEIRTFSSEQASTLSRYMRDRDLPIIRAKAKIMWTERERVPSIAGTVGPVYEHDLGPWATGESKTGAGVVDQIASFIAMQVTKPAAVIESMRVGYDPRRQLGDVIIVSSPTFMGVELKCLVVGVDEDASPDGYTQTLKVRIIEVTTSYVTYDDFAEAWGPVASYDDFAAAWGAVSTYNDFADDPLKGTY